MLRRLYRWLLHAVDTHGVTGLFRALQVFPSPAFPHPFDLAHGTDTSGHIGGEDLATGTPSDIYNTAYYAISPSTLRAALALLPEAPPGTTFVDLGCGKGRALLVAAEYAFPRIVGVELAPALCAIARENCVAHPRITVVKADAATVDLPPGALVVFLYHPFLRPVVRPVLRRLEQHPDPVYLLYANCNYANLLKHWNQLWDYALPLSPEDAAADRHGIKNEHFTLYAAPQNAKQLFRTGTEASIIER